MLLYVFSRGNESRFFVFNSVVLMIFFRDGVGAGSNSGFFVISFGFRVLLFQLIVGIRSMKADDSCFLVGVCRIFFCCFLCVQGFKRWKFKGIFYIFLRCKKFRNSIIVRIILFSGSGLLQFFGNQKGFTFIVYFNAFYFIILSFKESWRVGRYFVCLGWGETRVKEFYFRYFGRERRRYLEFFYLVSFRFQVGVFFCQRGRVCYEMICGCRWYLFVNQRGQY